MGIGAVPVSWHEFRHGWSPVDAEVIQEALVTLYVNGLEITSLMCTPSDLDALALGFLKNEGLIDGLHSVRDIFISRNECCVEVWVDHPVRLPKSKTITSGCGGGVTFLDQEWQCDPIPDCIHLRPELLGRFFNQLQGPDSLYSRTRGVHTAALVRGDEIIALAEDVGRHNTVDKVVGLCLLSSQETRGSILLTTGRISSEMLRKGAMMGCPLVASRNSPTSMSVAMAKEWNITLVGYVRRDSLRVYAHPERLWVEAPALELPMAGD